MDFILAVGMTVVKPSDNQGYEVCSFSFGEGTDAAYHHFPAFFFLHCRCRGRVRDDAFGKSLLRFAACINDERTRFENYEILERQESLVQQYKDLTGI